jgi:hypothetical protein
VHNRQQIRVYYCTLSATLAILARYGAHSSCPLNPEPRILSGWLLQILARIARGPWLPLDSRDMGFLGLLQ